MRAELSANEGILQIFRDLQLPLPAGAVGGAGEGRAGDGRGAARFAAEVNPASQRVRCQGMPSVRKRIYGTGMPVAEILRVCVSTCPQVAQLRGVFPGAVVAELRAAVEAVGGDVDAAVALLAA